MSHAPGNGQGSGHGGRNNNSGGSGSGHGRGHGQGHNRGGAGGGRGRGQGSHRGDAGGGRGRGRGGGMTDEQKTEIMVVAKAATIQVASEGTDDVIVPVSADGSVRHFANMVLSKPDFGAFTGQRQVRTFVNSCLLNLSNHHNVDTTGLLTNLSAHKGRERLVEIMSKDMSVDAGDHRSILSFQYVVLPFIGVLTRESVCQSTLTTEAGNIYSTVYNHHTKFLEQGVLPCMDQLLNRRSMQDNSRGGLGLANDKTVCHVDSFPRALLAITRLFYQLVKRIQDSKVKLADSIKRLRELQVKCQTVSSSTEEDRFLNEQVLAREIKRLESIVSDVQDSLLEPEDQDDSQRTSRPSRKRGTNMVHLAMIYDPPGHLSEKGQRHDNDHADIHNIKILPTQEEITCSRPPFLPSNGIAEARYFLQQGWRRQLDIHFRLYREDMLDSLKKGVQSFLNVLEKIEKKNEDQLLRTKELKKLLDDGVSLNVYGNVRFLGIECSKGLGGSVQIAFSQPQNIAGANLKRRNEFWERSRRRLIQGGLVCIASRSTTTQRNAGDANTNPPFRLILGVVTKRDPQIMAKDENFATVHIALADLKHYLTMLNSQTQRADEEQWFLVESTGGLFESYRPILAALQNCVPASLPFGKYIAPTKEESDAMLINQSAVDPPVYARAPGFRFDLSVIMNGQQLRLDATSPVSAEQAITVLQRRSRTAANDPNAKPLDLTQAKALVETLCREVSLISGPPGTGKTKIGVDLMRVLLHNKQAMNCGPILCICYTNHALDQFLEHLLDEGFKDIVRVGARSKSERLEDYNLESLMSSRDRPTSVRQALKTARIDWDIITTRIQVLEKHFRSEYPPWEFVQPHLMLNSPDQCDELETGYSRRSEHQDMADLDDGFTEVGRDKGQSPYDRWATGADIKLKQSWNKSVEQQRQENAKGKKNKNNNISNIFDLLNPESKDSKELEQSLTLQPIPKTDRPLRQLRGNVWEMSMRERQRLMDSWKTQVQGFMTDEMEKLIQQLEKTKRDETNARDDFRRSILRQTSVIGMTTNGAAKHQALIAAVAPKIIICEEAGEVLESHILAALSVNTHHLILIGDHLQLRPQIESYNLSSDSPIGRYHNLDMSLFERLVSSEHPLQLSKLTIQRRMRPEISSLIRNTLYPHLEDGDNVKKHPPVQGMGASLFFMDHSHAEDSKDEYGAQSFANTFEVNMVEALANYLIKNGYDKPGDIAVLTPYLGQLSKLRDCLNKSFMLVIDERDQEQLDEKEAENEGPAPSNINEHVGVQKVSMNKHLTLRTIDNYQGEEAKIVIITLVRSDAKENGTLSSSGSIGFLKSPNRTNVLLSRAQHGMFIIGNANLMAKEKHGIWPKVIDELRRFDRVGEGFPIAILMTEDTSW
ncbi:hypothetical protein BGX34_008995 [Mortierella sp. NVP85]|nr:hypothetical protein BGX34_008995 [Mortierella sp. NVP85]